VVKHPGPWLPGPRFESGRGYSPNNINSPSLSQTFPMKPIKNDNKLFEELSLAVASVGLNRKMIDNKRSEYKKAFSNFDPKKVAAFSPKKISSLLSQKSKIIRNKLKIHATIHNAKLILSIKKKNGSFSNYLWAFIKNKPLPFKTPSQKKKFYKFSEELSKNLKGDGFKFAGPAVCAMLMYRSGMAKIN